MKRDRNKRIFKRFRWGNFPVYVKILVIILIIYAVFVIGAAGKLNIPYSSLQSIMVAVDDPVRLKEESFFDHMKVMLTDPGKAMHYIQSSYEEVYLDLLIQHRDISGVDTREIEQILDTRGLVDGLGLWSLDEYYSRYMSGCDITLTEHAAEVFKIVNIERNKLSLPPLLWNNALYEAASIRAEECAVEFSHTRPDGRNCLTVLNDLGIFGRSSGENIASGQRNSKEVMASWMNSEGHRENILRGGFTEIAIGVYKDSKGNLQWVQIFAGP